MLLNRNTVSDHNDVSPRVALRQLHVQGVHDLYRNQPVHEQHIPVHHERRSVHSSLSPDRGSSTANPFRIASGVCRRLDRLRSRDDPDLHVHDADSHRQRSVVQHHVARTRLKQGPDLVHAVLVRARLRHAAHSDLRVLLPRHPQAEDRRTEEQVQGEEALA